MPKRCTLLLLTRCPLNHRLFLVKPVRNDKNKIIHLHARNIR